MPQIRGYTQNAWQGEKYQSRDIADIAKLIRQDIKEAVKKNELPKGAYSVTVNRYSGGCSCNIKIKSLEFPVLNAEEVRYRNNNPNWYSEGRASRLYTEVATLTLEKLKAIQDAYRRDDSDGMIDYFNTNFYGYAAVDYGLEHAETTNILNVGAK